MTDAATFPWHVVRLPSGVWGLRDAEDAPVWLSDPVVLGVIAALTQSKEEAID